MQHGDDVYIISGVSNGRIVRSVRRYNATTNVWTKLADIPVGSHAPTAAYLDGKIYVMDGNQWIDRVEVPFPNAIRIYDIATGTWSAGSVRPGDYALPGAAAGAFNGNVFFVGGGNWPTGGVFIYNVASDSWSMDSSLPPPRGYVEGGFIQVGQFLYVVGGYYWSSAFFGIINSTLCARLDMATNVWTFGPDFMPLRADFALAAIGTRLIAIGGDEQFGGFNDRSTAVSELDTSEWPGGTWQPSPINLPSPRQGNRAGFVSSRRAGGEIWTTGGLTENNNLVCSNEHLFRAEVIASAGSSIISAGANGVLDPGETVTLSLGLTNTGASGFCTPNALNATLQASSGVTNPSPSQNYGVICADGPVVFRNFTFTVDPNLPCGVDLTASLLVTDGTHSYGVPYVFRSGSANVILAENFDSVVAPALPPGWSATNASGPGLWMTSSASPETPPNAALINVPVNVSDERLETPSIKINSPYAQVSFRHSYKFRPVAPGPYNYDGGVLEVSLPNFDAGRFHDFTGVGGSFVIGGYKGRIYCCAGNPNFNVLAWTRDSGGYITTVANLGPNANGQVIKLRFRMTSSNARRISGYWRIDNFLVTTPVCGGR